MKVSELIFALLQMPEQADVYAVDQFGVMSSPVTGVYQVGETVNLDIEVRED
jgi:hypothetical protein